MNSHVVDNTFLLLKRLCAIKSARFPCASLLSLELCPLETADFLNSIELGAPSKSAFFRMDFIAFLIRLKAIGSPLKVKNKELSGLLLDPVTCECASQTKIFNQLFNFKLKTILAGP